MKFGFKNNKLNVEVSEKGYQSFSSPFLKVGNGNLSLPIVQTSRSGNGMVYFGNDNLYPQILNQMYYSSPLHGALVDFKSNAVVGGGYEYKDEHLNAKEKVDLVAFTKRLRLKQTSDILTKELIIHGRIYFRIKWDGEKGVVLGRVSPEKVRTNKDKSLYYVSDDWTVNYNSEQLLPFSKSRKAGEYLYCYEQPSIGQDVYPFPQYTACLNWIFLDGEMSFMHKSNIQNSIFPSFAMMFPKLPAGKEERNQIEDTLNKAKGAQEAGKVLALFAPMPELMPKIEAIPTNQNDQLFLQTDERIDSKICQAHKIDPIIFGIRVSGKLGSGTDIKIAYTIFEKTFVLPMREEVENLIGSLMDVCGIKGGIVFRDFQIINETIVEEQTNKVADALNAMSPLLANKVLENLTVNEIRALASLSAIEGGDELPGKTQEGGEFI
jgi:hypothetical protein